MQRQLYDRKTWIAFLFFSFLNKIVVRCRFKGLTVAGVDQIPKHGPFLIVSNHVSRFDGLVIHELIGRPSNWMVSPNELIGLKGFILKAMGAFPAKASYNLVNFVQQRTLMGEGIVIFPEGDIFRDGETRQFKNGASRIALSCVRAGISLTLLPLALAYDDGPKGFVHVNIGQPIELNEYVRNFSQQSNIGIRDLTIRLYREVCYLKQGLGQAADELFTNRPLKVWMTRKANANCASKEEKTSPNGKETAELAMAR